MNIKIKTIRMNQLDSKIILILAFLYAFFYYSLLHAQDDFVLYIDVEASPSSIENIEITGYDGITAPNDFQETYELENGNIDLNIKNTPAEGSSGKTTITITIKNAQASIENPVQFVKAEQVEVGGRVSVRVDLSEISKLFPMISNVMGREMQIDVEGVDSETRVLLTSSLDPLARRTGRIAYGEVLFRVNHVEHGDLSKGEFPRISGLVIEGGVRDDISIDQIKVEGRVFAVNKTLMITGGSYGVIDSYGTTMFIFQDGSKADIVSVRPRAPEGFEAKYPVEDAALTRVIISDSTITRRCHLEIGEMLYDDFVWIIDNSTILGEGFSLYEPRYKGKRGHIKIQFANEVVLADFNATIITTGEVQAALFIVEPVPESNLRMWQALESSSAFGPRETSLVSLDLSTRVQTSIGPNNTFSSSILDGSIQNFSAINFPGVSTEVPGTRRASDLDLMSLFHGVDIALVDVGRNTLEAMKIDPESGLEILRPMEEARVEDVSRERVKKLLTIKAERAPTLKK
ncbi:MAG: hypothetical protein ABIA04_02305 [Pseudomonadota bacterium]